MLLENTEGCVGGDIRDQLILPKWDANWQYPKILSIVGRAQLASTFQCARRGQRCPIQRIGVDCSGTPCQPFSRAGQQQGVKDTKRSFVAPCWARIHTLRRTPVLFHENVSLYPWRHVLAPLLPHHPVAREFESNPWHAGYNLIDRLRQVVAFLDDTQAQFTMDPMNEYIKVVNKMSCCITYPADIFLADRACKHQERHCNSTQIRCKRLVVDLKTKQQFQHRRSSQCHKSKQPGYLKGRKTTVHENTFCCFYWEDSSEIQKEAHALCRARHLEFQPGCLDLGYTFTNGVPICDGFSTRVLVTDWQIARV